MNSARPSWPTPSRMARAIASSGSAPRPVSGSGVMLGAKTRPGHLVVGPRNVPAGAHHAGQDRRAVRLPVVVRMAEQAVRLAPRRCSGRAPAAPGVASNFFVASTARIFGGRSSSTARAPRRPARTTSSDRGADAPHPGLQQRACCLHAPLVPRWAAESPVPERASRLDRSRQTAVDAASAAAIKHRGWPSTTTTAPTRRARNRAGVRAAGCSPRCVPSGWTWTPSAPPRASRRPALADRTDPLTDRGAGARSGAWPGSSSGAGTLGLHVGAAMPQGTLLEYAGRRQPEPARGAGPDRPLHRPRHAQRAGGWSATRGRRADDVRGARRRSRRRPSRSRAARVRPRADDQPDQQDGSIGRRARSGSRTRPRARSTNTRRSSAVRRVFERDRMALRFDDEALDAPASHHDPQLFRILESHAQKVLAETPATASLRERVRREVIQRLREGEPGIADIAQALATSERSLQRQATGRRCVVSRRRRRGAAQARRRLPGRSHTSR